MLSFFQNKNTKIIGCTNIILIFAVEESQSIVLLAFKAGLGEKDGSYRLPFFYFGNIARYNYCLYLLQTSNMEVCFKVDTTTSDYGQAILNTLSIILTNQTKIMALIDDLKTQVAGLQTQVTNLQTALDAEQAQIQQLLETNAQVVTDLNTQIANLNAQIAAGATPEQLNELATSLTAISNSVTTTKTDLQGTVADTTPAPQG